jgi:hypothetical protein
MTAPLTLYIPLSADAELEIRLVTRACNGITSDPQVIRCEPTGRELFQALDVLRGRDFLQQINMSSILE